MTNDESMMSAILPSAGDLDRLFRGLHGDPARHGWRIRMRRRFGYYSPEDWYQGTVDRLVTEGCRWIDVGGGKSVFPYNRALSRELAARCALLVGVDPSDNLEHNELVHRRVKSTIEAFRCDESFDLATLRMVAEHVERPELVLESLAGLIKPGGHVVIYTPNRWSPASVAASLIPNRWHSCFTRLLWETKEEDVFPTFYRMNTRRRLRGLFERSGFVEAGFACLDNCSVMQRFRLTCFFELCAWRFLRALGVKYPENDLLGVYRKV